MHPQRVVEAQRLFARWTAVHHLAQRYPLYTDYLQSLANAERLNAVHRYLRPLINQLKAESHERRYALIHALCMAVDYTNRHAGTSPVPGIPYELLEEIAIPTLLTQRTQKSGDPYAHLWLAMLPSRKLMANMPEPRELLDLAHQLAPSDVFIAERVADDQLTWIEFACHHLPECLLAPEDVLLRAIERLRKLIPLVRQERGKAITEQVTNYEQQVNEFVLRTPTKPRGGG